MVSSSTDSPLVGTMGSEDGIYYLGCGGSKDASNTLSSPPKYSLGPP